VGNPEIMALRGHTEHKDQQVFPVSTDLEDQQALLDHTENEKYRGLKERMDLMKPLRIMEQMVNKESKENQANLE
jgi:hypothetical protein